jgi:hypothetical protein
MRTLVAQSRVLAMARIDPRLVRKLIEDLRDDALVQRGEALRILLRVSNPAGEQSIVLGGNMQA